MEDKIAIGVDVGGSHITCAAVRLPQSEAVPGTLVRHRVDNKGTTETIMAQWAGAINECLRLAGLRERAEVGFAIPGPFNYKEGIALYDGGNGKYESLQHVHIAKELVPFLETDHAVLRFLNDATSFGVGVATQGKARTSKNVLVATLGTGFGAAFIQEGIPLVSHPTVPRDGCLWDKPYKSGMADDYFSTRWCIARYHQLTGIEVAGVKDIAEADTEESRSLFVEFGAQMADFMASYMRDFHPDLLVLGGNISLAGPLFLPALHEGLKREGIPVAIEISTLMEEAAILGAAQLFEPRFWEAVGRDLPSI